jgi:hypothetical protein
MTDYCSMPEFIAGLVAIFLANATLAAMPDATNQRSPQHPPGVVESRATVFEDTHTDPYDRSNYFGFNHAPSVTVLGGNRVMAAWFSGPFEGSVDQVIMGATSDDGGTSWRKARVINDRPRVSDFDPAFINGGNRSYLFFSNGRWASCRHPARTTAAGRKSASTRFIS